MSLNIPVAEVAAATTSHHMWRPAGAGTLRRRSRAFGIAPSSLSCKVVRAHGNVRPTRFTAVRDEVNLPNRLTAQIDRPHTVTASVPLVCGCPDDQR